MTDMAVFIALVTAVAVGGCLLGMLLVPRLERMAEPDEEDPGAGDDPAG